MSGTARVWSLWEFEPGVWGLLGLLLVFYLGYTRLRLTRAAVSWAAGLVAIFIALDSPLAVLGEHYLFSAHMLQHMLLEFAAAPALVAGLARRDLERTLQTRIGGPILRFFARPLLAFVAGMATLWVWHLPPLFEATLHHQGIHILMHLSFLATGAWFWFPLLAKAPVLRLKPIPSLVMLFSGALLNSVLGIILSFAAPGLYPTYLHPSDPDGVLHVIRDQWGFSAAFDQTLGGVLMWTIGGVIFLTALVFVLARWMNDTHADETFGHRAESTS